MSWLLAVSAKLKRCQQRLISMTQEPTAECSEHSGAVTGQWWSQSMTGKTSGGARGENLGEPCFNLRV